MCLIKIERGEGGDGRGNSICAWKLYILKCDGFVRNAPVYHVYPVSRTTSEERAEFSRGWSGGGGWGKRVFYSFRD